MDDTTAGAHQIDAITRCRSAVPIFAEEARKFLALFAGYLWNRSEREVQILIARISLDQSVRLENSIDELEKKSSALSRQVVYLNCVLAAMNLALLILAFVTYAKS